MYIKHFFLMVFLSLRNGCAIAEAVSLSFLQCKSIFSPRVVRVGSGGHSSTGVGFVWAFQLYHASYYSKNAAYSSVIRGWCTRPIWSFSTKWFSLTTFLA